MSAMTSSRRISRAACARKHSQIIPLLLTLLLVPTFTPLTQLHPILIPMTPSRLHCDPKCQSLSPLLVLFSYGDAVQLLDGSVGEEDGWVGGGREDVGFVG